MNGRKIKREKNTDKQTNEQTMSIRQPKDTKIVT